MEYYAQVHAAYQSKSGVLGCLYRDTKHYTASPENGKPFTYETALCANREFHFHEVGPPAYLGRREERRGVLDANSRTEFPKRLSHRAMKYLPVAQYAPPRLGAGEHVEYSRLLFAAHPVAEIPNRVPSFMGARTFAQDLAQKARLYSIEGRTTRI